MLKIIKNIFCDDDKIIGLCAFPEISRKTSHSSNDIVLNSFAMKQCFKPDISDNIYLSR